MNSRILDTFIATAQLQPKVWLVSASTADIICLGYSEDNIYWFLLFWSAD